MTLEELTTKLSDLNKAFKVFHEKVEAVEKILTPLAIADVLPGDVWCYLPNRKFKGEGFFVVKSVNKDKNRVEFKEGWNPYKDMISGEFKWVLVSREFTPELKEMVMKL